MGGEVTPGVKSRNQNSSKFPMYINSSDGVNANNLTNDGIYFNHSTSNTPLTTNHNMLVSANSVGTPFQLFFPDDRPEFYKRWFTKSSSTWSSWVRFPALDPSC